MILPFAARRVAVVRSARPTLALALALGASACAPLPEQGGVNGPGAPVSPAELRQAQAQSDVVELKRRVAALEGRDDTKTLDELRELRGEIERLRYQAESDTHRDRTQLDSLDRRLGLLEAAVEDLRRNGSSGGGYGYARPPVPTPAPTPAPTDTTTPVTTVTTPVPVGAPDAGVGLARPGDAEPVGSPPPEAAAGPGAEEALYLKGIETAKTGDYAAAQRIFASVATTYPRGAYADDAWYWNGEMAFAQHDYRAAHAAYQTLIERFPDSPKMPDALYKMGQCYQAMGQLPEANLLYRRVARDYPQTPAGRGAAQKLAGG